MCKVYNEGFYELFLYVHVFDANYKMEILIYLIVQMQHKIGTLKDLYVCNAVNAKKQEILPVS